MFPALTLAGISRVGPLFKHLIKGSPVAYRNHLAINLRFPYPIQVAGGERLNFRPLSTTRFDEPLLFFVYDIHISIESAAKSQVCDSLLSSDGQFISPPAVRRKPADWPALGELASWCLDFLTALLQVDSCQRHLYSTGRSEEVED